MVVVVGLFVLLPTLAVASLALAPAVVFAAATCGAFRDPRPRQDRQRDQEAICIWKEHAVSHG